MNDHKYWLGFSLVPEIGPKRLLHLLSVFGDLPSAWSATESDLRHSGLENQPVTNFLRTRARLDLDAEMAKVERAGAWLLTLADDSYPPLLSSLPDAPAVLYVKGSLLPSDEQALAVVGTRKASTYGRDAAHDLSRQLARNGITIVSGLAHGIDTAAHRGALDGGRTIAVVGCGLDQIYPRDNEQLAHEICQHGAMISEFAIGVPPEGRNFPRRNRVISGLSLGVLVIEAAEGSGALITAGIAAEQGREVFAVPGNIYNPGSRGSNRLIQDGAKLVMGVDDILSELKIAHSNVQFKTTAERVSPGNNLEATLIQNLSADPIHVDDLARLCDLPIATITSTLTIMELKGLARKVGPMQYCLVNKN